ncbi:uncharacterized protein LOC101859745 [Aplysia californica]|uniref:Uncharacterized protein LOC101859745 n=1 Tax=Aplysia californica TaxID=6500 RepID=A0ABM0JA15_APLCA|nr:uncharacterized protein LOC101859745 [Aplysia californica]
MTGAIGIVCVLAILTAQAISSPVTPSVCINALAPPTDLPGVNQMGNDPTTPLFRLHFTKHTENKGRRDSRQAYRVHLAVTSSRVAFSDAKVSLETTGNCGVGSLKYDSNDFFQARQTNDSCPKLLLTSHKTPMTELPSLIWTPPECGCVLVRVLVIEKGTVYYAEREGVKKGPLAQLVCVKKASREQYLDTLCSVLDRYLTTEIISSDSFLTRHRLTERTADRFSLDLNIKMRRSDARTCCSKDSSEERIECFNDSRWHRIDRFCKDGSPDLPLTELRMVHMRNREQECCFIFGKYRYPCFAEGNKAGRAFVGASPLDFSMDETDPANDVAEFVSEKDQDIVSKLTPLKFDVGVNEDPVETRKGVEQLPKDKFEKSNAKDTDNEVRNSNTKTGAVKRERKRKHHKATETGDVAPSLEIQGVHTTGTPSEVARLPPRSDHSFPGLVTDRSRGAPSKPRRKMVPGERFHDATNFPDDETDILARTLTNVDRRLGLRKSGETKSGRRSSGEGFGYRQNSGDIENYDGLLSSGIYDKARNGAPAKRLYPEAEGGASWMTRFSEYPKGRVLAAARHVSRGLNKRLSNADRRRKSSKVQHGIEDQGRASVDKTLGKLERKLQRLRLKQHCCEAGAAAGGQVYGGFTHAWRECSHSSEKLVDRLRPTFGHKVCREQFKKCCVEMSVSGPSMTSQEFREAEFQYLDNRQRIPASQMADHGFDGVGRETPEEYDDAGEKRYKSMREVPDDEDFFDEEYNGPARFDEIDDEMAAEYGGLDRSGVEKKDEETKKKALKSKRRKDTKNDDDVDDDDDVEDEDEDEKFELELGLVDVGALEGQVVPKKEVLRKNDKNTTETSQKEFKKGGQTPQNSTTQTAAEKEERREAVEVRPKHHRKSKEETENKEAAMSGFDAQVLDIIGRPTQPRAPSRSQNTPKQRRRRKHHGGSSKRGRSRSRSKEGRRRSSRRSSRKSKERRHRGGRHRYGHKTPQYHHPFGPGGAKDSHEMAAINTRRMAGGMDSKELAEAFSQGTFAHPMRDRTPSRSRSQF